MDTPVGMGIHQSIQGATMKKILIVDDEKDVLTILKSFLVKQGYSITTTITCTEGLEILREFQPDLVLLDINVGTEDGRVMCQSIKASAEHEHIPVILMSANHDKLRTYSQYGASDILLKPYEFSNLLRLVRLHTLEPGSAG